SWSRQANVEDRGDGPGARGDGRRGFRGAGAVRDADPDRRLGDQSDVGLAGVVLAEHGEPAAAARGPELVAELPAGGGRPRQEARVHGRGDAAGRRPVHRRAPGGAEVRADQPGRRQRHRRDIPEERRRGTARGSRLLSAGRLAPYSSKPTNTAASSTALRFETTALAGKSSSGQPMATQIMITWSSGMAACSRTTGLCMMPWLLITHPSPRDQAALTSALVTAPQSNGAMSPPWIERSKVTTIETGASNWRNPRSTQSCRAALSSRAMPMAPNSCLAISIWR